MAEDFHQLHAIVSGRVQGVNFRYYTARRARELGLSGWVRNLPDGTVEVVAEGERPSLEQLLVFLHTGPPAARVTRVEADWRPATYQFDSFDIR